MTRSGSCRFQRRVSLYFLQGHRRGQWRPLVNLFADPGLTCFQLQDPSDRVDTDDLDKSVVRILLVCRACWILRARRPSPQWMSLVCADGLGFAGCQTFSAILGDGAVDRKSVV